MTEFQFEEFLTLSGVHNEFSHCEDGTLHTAITSREELLTLVELAYNLGAEELQRNIDEQEMYN